MLKAFRTKKHPEPVLCPEYPCEEKHIYLYGSVIELEDRLRMYYQSYVDGIGFFVCLAESTDGVKWTKSLILKFLNKKTKKTWFSDVAPVFYDQKRKLYRAIVKTYKIDEQGRTRRCVSMSMSRDFIHWSKPRTLWIPSEKHDRMAQRKGFKWADFYGLCPFNYKDYYLSFLWLFMIGHEFLKGTHEGKIEVYLAHSKDCMRWELVSEEPVIPVGEEGSWDSGMITTANQPNTVEGEAFRTYYSGTNFKHGTGEYERELKEYHSSGISFVEVFL